ncbi:hypothetical protein TRIUR3_05984 [Triticum urartu]|uniref:Uncharacterized protein n=1 Tax=Triticum urartu TaxID=4572 RepID=M8A2A6_TRIUA|nr:hypothetical protein TRIUR3_05984 [Triticum urartu]
MHRSPFKDITNSSMIENANVTTNSQEAKKNTLYARMSDEKRAAFLEKRRMSRQEKKSQALNIVNGQLTVEAHAPLGSKECTSLRSITNTHTNGGLSPALCQMQHVLKPQDALEQRDLPPSLDFAGKA